MNNKRGRAKLLSRLRAALNPMRCSLAVNSGEPAYSFTPYARTTTGGIGDFGDLKQMVLNVAKRGGAFVGLNPIHSLYPANPESASPYSPSSRRWLNVAYIDVNQVEEFKHSAEAQAWWNNAETQLRLSEARASEWVDYTSVITLKLNALQRAYPEFTKQKAVASV